MRQPDPICSVARKAQPPGYRFEASCYEQFHMIHVQSGRLHVCVGKSDTEVSPGTSIVLGEESAFRLYCSDQGYTGIGVVAVGNAQLSRRGRVDTVAAGQRARQLAEILLAHAVAPSRRSRHILEALGQALTLLTLDELDRAHSGGPAEARPLAERVRAAIDAAVRTNLGLREILDGFDLSYRHLGRIFAAEFGMPPKAYQLQAKIEQARALLQGRMHSVTDVAYELGFSSSQHFATQFKRHVGTAPTSYWARAGDVAAPAKDRLPKCH